MASNAWLVTTMSAWPATARAFSAKHSAPNGQRATPRHSRAETLSWDQDRSGTPGVSSSRSPVSVVDAHAVSRCTSRPSAVLAVGSNRASSEVFAVVGIRAGSVVNLVQAEVVSATLEDREAWACGVASFSANRPAAAGRVRRAGVAARWSQWKRPQGNRFRPRGRSPAQGRPAICPCPVPACTARCSPVSNACATASAIATWPVRSLPPSASTAVASRSVTAAAGVAPPRRDRRRAPSGSGSPVRRERASARPTAGSSVLRPPARARPRGRRRQRAHRREPAAR